MILSLNILISNVLMILDCKIKLFSLIFLRELGIDVKTDTKLNQWAGLIGSVLEHHDKALFALLAPFIAPYYFPSENLISSFIEIYGVIVLSLLVRPLAAIFFGPLADRKGRKQALLISMLGMSLTTTLMGLLPSYAEWGFFAPLALFILRCGQNFFVTGELSGGAIFVIEHASPRHKALMSSLFETSIMLGVLLASVETTLLAYFGLLQEYWHYMFIVAGLLSLLTALFRSKLEETPEFKQVIPMQKKFDWNALYAEKSALGLVVLLSAFSYATYIFSITFVNAFIKLISPATALELTSVNTLIIVIDLLTLPLFGWLSIRYSAVYLMRFATFMTALLALPLFAWMVFAKTIFAIISVRLIIVVLGVCFAASHRAWLLEHIPIAKRGTVLSVGTTIGQLIAEGPLTMLSLFFLQMQIAWVPGILMGAIALITGYTITRVETEELEAVVSHQR